MDIAIIGAGNVGSALAGVFGKEGHSVTISAASPESAEAVARDADAHAVAGNREAVEAAEAVVLAVPNPDLEDVLAEIGEALEGKIVIDVTNRLAPQDPGAMIDGTSNAERIQARVPGARVVKALNTVLASHQAHPVVEGIEIDGFVAADDEEGKKAVLELLESIGLRPIDAGPLTMARALEAMAALNISLNMRNNWSWQTGWKLVGPTA
jgi:8-hydroxy-5-deazaflavin:NADPH oxidoreductase